ncbi:MAG: glycosyltransferase family 9 protein [Bacteroidetes bacterium]|nr:glycosyltransferase family 9 protein [Bacteroidota bacterium]
MINKLLIIRLSSIGDIVLTTPVVRALRQAHPQAEIHYLTKARFAEAIAHNPHIDRLHRYEGSLRQAIATLRAERFDHIVDLHGNWRSFVLRTELAVPATVFPKMNGRKLLMTLFKARITVPHVVDRYALAAAPLGAMPDDQGLEFPYPAELDVWAAAQVMQQLGEGPLPYALCLSASYTTKRWLPAYYRQYLNTHSQPCILLGGPSEQSLAAQVLEGYQGPVFNAVGTTHLLESAALLKQCTHLITPDTGMMHIAAALQVPAVTLWGNTVPGFGMGPYRAPHVILEEQGLGCRPCSKLGHHRCPKGHFRCMHALTPERVSAASKALLS